jgi:hypothetical protein
MMWSMAELTRDHVLALLTAHPDTWQLADVPPWLAKECEELGLIVREPNGAWKLTVVGYRERSRALAS